MLLDLNKGDSCGASASSHASLRRGNQLLKSRAAFEGQRAWDGAAAPQLALETGTRTEIPQLLWWGRMHSLADKHLGKLKPKSARSKIITEGINETMTFFNNQHNNKTQLFSSREVE